MRICSGIVCKRTGRDRGGQFEGSLVHEMFEKTLAGVFGVRKRYLGFGKGLRDTILCREHHRLFLSDE